MNQKRRYERRADGNAPVIDNRPEEIVTGIPATDEVPAGSPQFEVFKQHEQDAAKYDRVGEAAESIEDRDNRGEAVDGKGKIKEQISIIEVEGIASEAVAGFARDIDRVQAQADGNTLTVTVTTKHGHQKASAEVSDWTDAGVKKAMKEIEDKMSGKASSSDAPESKLAEAVRDVASGKTA